MKTVVVPLATLEHLIEYWNGSSNERAMSDALDHIIEELQKLAASPPSSEPVAQAAAQDMAKSIHYPECWDTAAYPTLDYALMEVCGAAGCSAHPPTAAPAVEVPPEPLKVAMMRNATVAEGSAWLDALTYIDTLRALLAKGAT